MVEILLSLVLLIAAVIFALWPSLGIHDHTIDGLFLTVTGSMLSLIFLFNFIWQLRHRGAEEVTAIRQAWKSLVHAFGTLRVKGGTGMRSHSSRIGVPLVMGSILLLILAFPSKLNAKAVAASNWNALSSRTKPVLAIAAPRAFPKNIFKHGREHSERDLLLMDADVRMRAAAALDGNPVIGKPAEGARVPLRLIVIAASPLLEV